MLLPLFSLLGGTTSYQDSQVRRLGIILAYLLSHPTLKLVTYPSSSVYLYPLHFSPSSQQLPFCLPYFTRLESSPPVSLSSTPSPTPLTRLLTLLKS